VLRLELLDRFKIRGVCNDLRKLLQLLQLIQICFGLFLNNSSAHNNSSFFCLALNVRPNQQSTNGTRSRNSGQHTRKTSKHSSSVKQARIFPKALQSSVANQSLLEQNCFQVPTLDRGICDIR